MWTCVTDELHFYTELCVFALVDIYFAGDWVNQTSLEVESSAKELLGV